MLTCSKCGHSDQIEPVKTRWGKEIHCHTCGNVAIEGVKAQWPIEEKAVKIDACTGKPIKPIGSKVDIYGREYKVVDHVRYYHGGETALLDKVEQEPAIIEAPLHDNQEDSMATKPLCSVEGCEKKVWVKGYCAKHYTEAFGKAYKPPSEAAKRASRVKAKPEAIQERVEQGKIPLFQIFLDPELLDELTKKAKAEYRTPEQQAAYLIDKALKKELYSL